MAINSLYQLMSIRLKTPELLQQASRLLFMPDLLNYCLTGVQRSERTIASTSQFYNPAQHSFSKGMLGKLGIPAGILAELAEPGAPLGPVLPDVADQCGLAHKTTVYATGCHDTASAVAAVPAQSSDGWCYISSGTWSLMGVETDAPVINAASLEANFTNEVGVCNKIRLLKNIAGLWVLQECRRAWAKEGHEHSYAQLMDMAAAAKPLNTVLDLDSFVTPGHYPDRIRRHCRERGQEVPSDIASMTRVILYSLAVRYKEVLESLERLTGKSIGVIHIVGGGSKNHLLNQFAADVTGRTVISGPSEATAAGNALTQALGGGQITDLEQLREIVRRSFGVETFHPKT